MELYSRSFWKDLFLTYAAETVVMLCAIMAPALVTRLGGMDDLGIYLLVRRLVSSFIAPLTLGIAVALARFLPLQNIHPGIQIRWSILGIGVAAAFGAICALLLVGFGTKTAELVLGSSALAVYAGPLALLTFGNVMHAVLYGHYRGMMRMGMANTMQALNLGIVPVVALLRLRTLGLAKVINLTGVLTLVVVAGFLAPLLWQVMRTKVTSAWMREAWRSLLSYGLGRVPGFAFAGLLFAIGPIWLAHRALLSDVAIYALAISFMRIAGAFFAPVGLLILPRLSAALDQGHHESIQRDLVLLLWAATLFALFACLQAATLSDTLLLAWLGSSPPSSRLFFVPLVLTLPIYMAYEVLRNPIDAAATIPYNTIALAAALLAFVLVAVVGNSTAWLVAGQLGSFLVLGGITVYVLFRLYRFRSIGLQPWLWPGLYCVAAGSLTWLAQRQFSAHILFLSIYEILLFGGFVGLMIWIGRERPRDSC
jgi:O-antigen/teichoic acid export membrane protein